MRAFKRNNYIKLRLRLIDTSLPKKSNITAAQMFQMVTIKKKQTFLLFPQLCPLESIKVIACTCKLLKEFRVKIETELRLAKQPCCGGGCR